MRSIINIKLWLIFIEKLLKAVFPVYYVLIIFSALNYKKFKNTPVLRLLGAFVLFGMAYRLFIFFSGIPFSGRYFYSLIIPAVLASVPGLFKLSEYIRYYLGKTNFKAPLKNMTFSLTAVLCLISAGKALNPDFSKKWIFEIADKIKELCPEGERPVLVATVRDKRFSFYAGAEYVHMTDYDCPIRWRIKNGKIERHDNCIYGALALEGKGKYSGAITLLDYPPGLKHLKENIKKTGGERVFILLEESRDDFRKRIKEAGLTEAPARFVKEFHDRKGHPLTLYQGFKSENKSLERQNDVFLTDYDHLSE
jgi:hypothetical protein